MWALCNDKEWLERTALLVDAGEQVLVLKDMSLSKTMENLLMQMRTAERSGGDVTVLAGEYAEVMRQKQRLKTRNGRLEFFDGILTPAYERWKNRGLPLED
jgi:hypothetical protein